jgi:mono/diheme cytochrome c family protein/glucose/arabinose dehydrogenase
MTPKTNVPPHARLLSGALATGAVLLLAFFAAPPTASEGPARKARSEAAPPPAYGPHARADGEEIYNNKCATCHQQDGKGLSGVFPPLVDTDWVTGDAGLLIRILLHGMEGEMQVNGRSYNGAMPPWGGALSDEEIAQVATYVRTSWGNRASEVTAGQVARVREAGSGRNRPWTAAELRAAVQEAAQPSAGAEGDAQEADEAGGVDSETTDRDPVDDAAATEQEPDDPPPAPAESDFYRLVSIPLPEGLVFGVGGLAQLPGGQMAVATRRGDVWIVENPSMQGGARPSYTRFARGLHEPLGLAYSGGALYAAQRTELTRLEDADGDDRAERYETVATWPTSGNYHEYAFGPKVRPGSDTMVVSLNAAWTGNRMASPVPWRGWIMEIAPDGRMTPLAPGMRSPAGLGFTPGGALLYSENQGGWVGSGRITHVERGDFAGHPAGLRWTGLSGAPLSSLAPGDVPDTGRPMHEVKETAVPALELPTVWLPHGALGISTTDILPDTTGGAFGPFEGQFFVGDQGSSIVSRVDLERVKGVLQGAAFPFREGFASGVVRLAWGSEGALYAGMTARGWAAAGGEPFGFQRLEWTGEMPFEVETMRARPDGFRLTFTRPVDPAHAGDPSAYDLGSYTYKYHSTYGSPVIDRKTGRVTAVEVAPDSMSARLEVEGLRRHYIHKLTMPGVRSADGAPLLHDTAYYTLHRLPEDRSEETARAPVQDEE